MKTTEMSINNDFIDVPKNGMTKDMDLIKSYYE